MTKTRTQQRGVCCYCGKEHALAANETMVAHGYTIEWNQQFGNCSGVGCVHLGHENAPEELKSIIKSFEAQLERLPSMIEKKAQEIARYVDGGMPPKDVRIERRKIAQWERGLKIIPEEIERVKKQLANWSPKAPRLVDLDVEEAEQRKVREAEAAQKKADKHEQAKAKAAAAAEREAKAAAKWALILSENLHQIEENGAVLVEWVASYESRKAMERDHAERLSQWCDENGVNDTQDRIDMAWTVTMRVRENSGKNKQLHKW
ncbi:hypothetical protein NTE19_003353 [Vibrio fluvialis]|nr:hypothetical protein [Vibrio fluvialis]